MNLTRNDFGTFVYKDHVTRKVYDFNKLKGTSNSLDEDILLIEKPGTNINSLKGYIKQQAKGNKEK